MKQIRPTSAERLNETVPAVIALGQQLWDTWSCSPTEKPAAQQKRLGMLQMVAELHELADSAEFAAVMRARAFGDSWASIADALGVSKQAVWEKYHAFPVQ